MRPIIYYLGVRYSEETNRVLTEYRLCNGLENYKMPNLEFHTTLAYSRNPFTTVGLPSAIGGIPKWTIGTAYEPAKFAKSLVLLCDSDWLERGHNILINNGATHDYVSYTPHITIAEEYNGGMDLQKAKVPLFVEEIFYREYK